MGGKKIFHGAIANALALGMTIIVNLALTPYLIGTLGIESYGLWTLVLSLSITHGFLSFADFGLASSIVKMVGEYASVKDEQRSNETISGGLILLGSVGLILCIFINLIAYYLIASVFEVPGEFQTATMTLARLMSLVVFIDLVKITLSAALQGVQEFALYKSIQAGGNLIQALLIVCFLSIGGSLESLGIAALASSFLQAIVYALSLRRVIPWWRLTFVVSNETRSRLLRTSSIIFFIRLQSAVYRSMDRIIIGIVLVPAILAEYDIVSKIAGLALASVTIVSSMMVAPAAELISQKDTGQLKKHFLNSTRFSLIISLLVLVLIFLYVEDFLSLWVGPQFVHLSFDAILLASHVAFVALSAAGQNMLIGTGRLKSVAFITSVMTSINLGLSLFLVRYMEMRGVITGTLVSAIASAIIFQIVISKEFRVERSAFLRKLILPGICPFVAALAIHFLLSLFTIFKDPIRPEFELIAVISGYLLVVFFYSIDKAERKVLSSYLQRFRK